MTFEPIDWPLGPKDLERALNALRCGPDDCEKAAGRIQVAAFFFRAHQDTSGLPPMLSPSEAERKWASMSHAIEGVFKTLAAIRYDTHLYEDFCGAADQLANGHFRVVPPHVSPDWVPVPPLPGVPVRSMLTVWPIDEAWENSMQTLLWLTAVTGWAAKRAAMDKSDKGGKRPDQASHSFVFALAQIYEEFSNRKPDRPSYKDVTGTYTGDFLDFVEPVFGPVDQRSRAAIAQLIVRAIFD